MGELNPYILYTDVNTYRNASGGEWVYDISFITKAESQGEAMTPRLAHSARETIRVADSQGRP